MSRTEILSEKWIFGQETKPRGQMWNTRHVSFFRIFSYEMLMVNCNWYSIWVKQKLLSLGRRSETNRNQMPTESTWKAMLKRILLGYVIKGRGWLRQDAHQINVANGDTSSTFEARVPYGYLRQSISQNGWIRSRRWRRKGTWKTSLLLVAWLGGWRRKGNSRRRGYTTALWLTLMINCQRFILHD